MISMQIDTSTINVLLGLVVACQVWIIRELFTMRQKLAIIISLCPRCRARLQDKPKEDDI